MSFIKLFDGDLDLSSKYPGQNLTPNISDKLFAATPLKIYGFNGLASEVNGNYSLTGETCNCFPSLEKNTSILNATLTSSSNFFNSDSFHYFQSPSVKGTNTYDSLYAHPDFFTINKDSSKFSGQSHYINFSLNTDVSNSNSNAIFGFLFDDENNNLDKKYLNYNLLNSTIQIGYSFISENSKSFSTGLLIKQLNNTFILDFGSTGSNATASAISLSKNIASSTFDLIHGATGSSLDLSGKTPFELGVYFKDSSSGNSKGLATNFSVQINNISPQKYYIFNKDNKTVISDEHCSISGSSNYIYSTENLNDHCHYFNPSNGSTALFTNQKGYAVNYGLESKATTSFIKNSDADATIDSLDTDPYGMYGAGYSVLSESLFSNLSIGADNKMDFTIEGFKYSYDGTDNSLTSSNNITDIPSMFKYIATLINAKTLETGVRAEKYPLSDDLIFWRPKGGDFVSGACSVGAEILQIKQTNFNYYITPTP